MNKWLWIAYLLVVNWTTGCQHAPFSTQSNTNVTLFFKGKLADQDTIKGSRWYNIRLMEIPQSLLALAVLYDDQNPVDTLILSDDSPGIVLVEETRCFGREFLKVGYRLRSSGCTQNALQSLVGVRNGQLQELLRVPLYNNAHCLVSKAENEGVETLIGRYDLMLGIYREMPFAEVYGREKWYFKGILEQEEANLVRYQYDTLSGQFFREK